MCLLGIPPSDYPWEIILKDQFKFHLSDEPSLILKYRPMFSRNQKNVISPSSELSVLNILMACFSLT